MTPDTFRIVCRLLVTFWLQLCDGASPEERERWKLKPAKEFHYLNQSTCYEIPGDSNAEEYKVTQGGSLGEAACRVSSL